MIQNIQQSENVSTQLISTKKTKKQEGSLSINTFTISTPVLTACTSPNQYYYRTNGATLLSVLVQSLRITNFPGNWKAHSQSPAH